MDHQISLPSLTPREAVADALHRCIDGIDDKNTALLESACVTDESISMVFGEQTVQGWAAIYGYLSTKIFPLCTSHFVTNIRVNLKDGADTASLTAHAVAYHIRSENAFTPENKSFTTAGLYFMDLIKDSSDGLWKVKKWTLKLLWTEGDRATIA